MIQTMAIMLNNAKEVMCKWFNTIWDSWFPAMITAILTYFTPAQEVLLVLFAVVSIDFIFGIWASFKREIPITSRKLRKTIVKLLCYLFTLLLMFSVEKAVGVDWVAPFKLVSGFILFIEALSVLENLTIITEHPMFVAVVKFIRGKAKSKYGSITDDIFTEKHVDEVDDEK